jgi:N-acetylneuraminic acid mutarotase
MAVARGYLGAALANDGQIYIIGGDSTNENENAAYNTQSDSYTSRANMPTARFEHCVVKGPDGLIYAIGGVNSSYTGLATVEAYNPATNTWATKPSLPAPRWNIGCTVANNLIYVIGGNGGLPTYAYDTTTNTWATKHQLNASRFLLAATTGPDGTVYAIGGASIAGAASTVEAYNAATDTWSYRTNMPIKRKGLAIVTANNGLIYAIGGSTSGPALTTVEAFDPATNAWIE